MNEKQIHILLADDDTDDCHLFKDVLKELPINTYLTTVDNGENLMTFLKEETKALPDVLFLDLNMPRKNGFECLTEIKLNEKLRALPVIIFSTSYNHDIISQLKKNGARHYIRKPSEYSRLKKVVHTALSFTTQPVTANNIENFILES